jgi:hypothetical protein
MSTRFQTITTGRQRWLDGLAVTASILCLIHCLLLPALLIALPVLAAMLVVPESVHAIAFVLAVPISLLAILSARGRHARRWPFRIAGVGLVLLGVGAFAVSNEMIERIVTSAGAVLLALAHIGNWRALSHHAEACRIHPTEDQA